jgi:hypothetical protein
MADTNNERFDIVFAGECLDGHDPAGVRAALGKLFKADEATLDRLFSGKRQRVKRGCDKATALRYQQAMTGVGARPIVTRSSEIQETAKPAAAGTASTASRAHSPQRASASRPAPGAGPDAGAEQPESAMSLLPAGSDMLAPAERKIPKAVELDLEHISLAAPGERLSDAQPAPRQVVEAPKLDVAEIGSTLSVTEQPAAIAPPDTSEIRLAPPDHDLSDCSAPPAATPQLNLDRLELAPSGTDLLGEHERHRSAERAPDTSHLQLEDPVDR